MPVPPEPHLQPVPKVRMDYLYPSREDEARKSGVDGMCTHELKRELREAGKAGAGPRHVIKKTLRECARDEDKREEVS